MNRTTPSALVKIARVGAVALAIGVVGYLVWRAQAGTQPARDVDRPAGNAAPDDPLQDDPLQDDLSTEGEANMLDLPASLSTSKSLAPDVILLPSSKDPGPDTLMPSSKSARVPVIPSFEGELIFSSKFGPPLVPEKPKADERRPNDN